MSELTAEKFIENWYGAEIPKGWDKNYDPLQNLSITELKQMLNEFAEQKANGVTTGEKQCNLPDVSGSYSYEIDFGIHCRAGIDITNNEPKVIGAINGWGDGISLADIKIKKL